MVSYFSYIFCPYIFFFRKKVENASMQMADTLLYYYIKTFHRANMTARFTFDISFLFIAVHMTLLDAFTNVCACVHVRAHVHVLKMDKSTVLDSSGFITVPECAKFSLTKTHWQKLIDRAYMYICTRKHYTGRPHLDWQYLQLLACNCLFPFLIKFFDSVTFKILNVGKVLVSWRRLWTWPKTRPSSSRTRS